MHDVRKVCRIYRTSAFEIETIDQRMRNIVVERIDLGSQNPAAF